MLEAYSEEQPRYGTAVHEPDLLLTVPKVEELFVRRYPQLETLLLQQIEREVVEGYLHTGLASVVQYVARLSDIKHNLH